MTTDPTRASYHGVAAEAADNSHALQRWLDYLGEKGGEGLLDVAGVIDIKAQVYKHDAARPFSIRGPGKYTTTIRRAADFAGAVLAFHRNDGLALQAFSVDGGYSQFPVNAGHGITVYNANDVWLHRLRITNYKNSPALVYADPEGDYHDNVVDRCDADGGGVAANGWIVADLVKSGIRHCTVRGISKTLSPGAGLSLKNRARYCFIENSHAESCRNGITLGQDILAPSHEYCRVSDVTAVDCVQSVITGWSRGVAMSGLVIDHRHNEGHPIDLQETEQAHIVVQLLKNVNPSRCPVRFRSGTKGCVVKLGIVGFSGSLAQHDSGSSGNVAGLW